MPLPLADGATGRDLADFALAWIKSAGCERTKRRALIEAWPR